MPPTKYMPGDIFQGHIIDGMFNFTGIFTGQEILLLGMLTEAVVTPWLSDRDLALQNVRYVFNAAGSLPRTSCRATTASSNSGRTRCSPRRSTCSRRSSTRPRAACSQRSATAPSAS
jgi:hypothetical protein